MAIQVLIFGSLTDIVESPLQLEQMVDTNMLVNELNRRYPGLGKAKYVIAVNKKMIDANTSLQNNDVVALMPPYSGG
jgi:molybdopterin converting factor small subunit